MAEHSSRDEADNAADRPHKPGDAGAHGHADPSHFNQTFRDLLNLYRELSREGAAPQVTDAITQALLTVLGSGPSFAVLESMISVNQANGLMYHNSVSLQQKTNILGMVATAKCVKSLLNLPSAAEYLEDLDLDEEADA